MTDQPTPDSVNVHAGIISAAKGARKATAAGELARKMKAVEFEIAFSLPVAEFERQKLFTNRLYHISIS
jgi:hypothetical protein